MPPRETGEERQTKTKRLRKRLWGAAETKYKYTVKYIQYVSQYAVYTLRDERKI